MKSDGGALYAGDSGLDREQVERYLFDEDQPTLTSRRLLFLAKRLITNSANQGDISEAAAALIHFANDHEHLPKGVYGIDPGYEHPRMWCLQCGQQIEKVYGEDRYELA